MLAQEEARRMGHNFVATEQLLLGLIGEGTGLAAKALNSNGITLKDARREVEAIIGRGSGYVAVEIPFTQKAKAAFEAAWDEARQLGTNDIGTGHLLLGVASNEKCIACTVLQNMSVEPVQLKLRMREILASSGTSEESSSVGDLRAPFEAKSQATKQATKVCPNCAQSISAKALACYFCGYGLSEAHFVDCHYCKERIRKGAIKCRYCYTVFDSPSADVTTSTPIEES